VFNVFEIQTGQYSRRIQKSDGVRYPETCDPERMLAALEEFPFHLQKEAFLFFKPTERYLRGLSFSRARSPV